MGVGQLFEGCDERLVDVGDVEIHCVMAGGGPPVLLLHGYPQSLALGGGVAPALAERYAMFTEANRHIAGAYRHWYFLSLPEPFPERMIGADPDYVFETCFETGGGRRSGRSTRPSSTSTAAAGATRRYPPARAATTGRRPPSTSTTTRPTSTAAVVADFLGM